MAKYDADFMESVGPPWDAICGTAGMSTNLNAVVAAGHSSIVLAPGAILTANLTLSGSDGAIWSFQHRGRINLGAYYIWISGSNWHLEGFELNGSASTLLAFTGTSANCSVERVLLQSGGSHGMYFTTSGGNHSVTDCAIIGNTGDGVKIASGSNGNRIVNNQIYGNTGYGVNDASSASIVGLNRIAANTAGNINGTPEVYLDDDVLNKLT